MDTEENEEQELNRQGAKTPRKIKNKNSAADKRGYNSRILLPSCFCLVVLRRRWTPMDAEGFTPCTLATVKTKKTNGQNLQD